MDLELSAQQKLLKKHIKKFSSEVLDEWAGRLDRDSCPLPAEIIKEMGGLNIWGLQAPAEYGGAGIDSVSYSIVIEEISRVSASIGLSVTVHNSVCLAPILDFGNEYQKKKYLPPLVSGEKLGGFTLTEPNAGSDPMSLQTSAVRERDSYVLNGRKAFVTNGGTAEIFLVAAAAGGEGQGKNIGIFIVEKDSPGFSVGKVENMMGMRGNMVSELFFDNLRVPESALLGREEDGFRICMKTLDAGRIGIASQALGIGMAAYEAAALYSTERRQFGRPISSFQGVSFKLADMKTRLDSARYLIYRAACLKDSGQPYSSESAMCKLAASEAAMYVCREALQIFGGYGYVKDLPVERYFRDAKITEIYEGTSEIMRVIIAGAINREFSKN